MRPINYHIVAIGAHMVPKVVIGDLKRPDWFIGGHSVPYDD